MHRPRLTYFSSRGRAELVRCALAEAGVPYDNVYVGVYDAKVPTPAFAALRDQGVLAFDALPLWEEDGFRLVQSDAILRHVGRTHGRYGRGAQEAARIDQFLGGIDDTRLAMRRLMTVPAADRAALRAGLIDTTLPLWLSRLERAMEPHGYVVGDAPSIADVALWYLVESLHDNQMAAALAGAGGVRAHHERIGARPGLAAWIASPERFPPQLLPV